MRETLDKWLTQESLAPKQRAAAGVARAWLEDLPVGVGIIETAPKRPDFLWCGAKGEVSAGEGNPLRKAFPKLPGFKLGEPKGRQHRAWGSFTQFDCTRITKPFFISRYPVTVAQYQLFVEAGATSVRTISGRGRAGNGGKAARATARCLIGCETSIERRNFPSASEGLRPGISNSKPPARRRLLVRGPGFLPMVEQSGNPEPPDP